MDALGRPVLSRVLRELDENPALLRAVMADGGPVPLASTLPVPVLARDSVDAAGLMAAAPVR